MSALLLSFNKFYFFFTVSIADFVQVNVSRATWQDCSLRNLWKWTNKYYPQYNKFITSWTSIDDGRSISWNVVSWNLFMTWQSFHEHWLDKRNKAYFSNFSENVFPVQVVKKAYQITEISFRIRGLATNSGLAGWVRGGGGVDRLKSRSRPFLYFKYECSIRESNVSSPC